MRGCIGCLLSALFYLLLGWVVYSMAFNLIGVSILGVPALLLLGFVVYFKLRG